MFVTDVLEIRSATADDIPAIVDMLADDPLGATRESPADLAPYLAALERIAASPSERLMVAVLDGKPVGTMQINIVHGFSQRGMTRAIIQSVRVHKNLRGQGLGSQLMRWAIAESRGAGARQVQLSSDDSRTDAHRFYERLGFTGSSRGFKMSLADD